MDCDLSPEPFPHPRNAHEPPSKPGYASGETKIFSGYLPFLAGCKGKPKENHLILVETVETEAIQVMIVALVVS